ncbi:aminotransferase class I/II-fold pyridoxal phosphate-dependent enzyme [Endozoicomonas ascidiicola]|uniref:aminotransferase class I/II-fold pyridoxal phosphate-dependent enzyme n=1 Tax=Endozoicomonas ascidiicola TaxID=1698521 RepID=UPI00083120EF|nr:aminotransferase class I/II-fold pyridoxal phosphate-dependent enzyme [Endozoicomonas ascidiicola]
MQELNNILVTSQYTLKDALVSLDKSGASVLLLVDEEGVLQRTVTDGDIRRLLLTGFGMEDTLTQLPAKKPVSVEVGISGPDALAVMNKYEISQLPVIDGDGRPVALHLRSEIQPRILLSIPHMGELEQKYVEEAFRTNWIAPLGPNVDGFEKEISEYVKTGHAAAVSSGTAAIHLALRLLDVGYGDTVFCSSFTFVASANPVLYQGARPVFIDSEPDTWNMSPQALERAIQESLETGQKPKAVIVVHLYGQSAKMSEIMTICNRYDVPVVEDAAESLGGLHQGQHTGTFGKFGVFSFNGNKIITTSGGGMLISNERVMVEKARYLSTQARMPAPHYEHTEVGYNYRMSNVLAGIGRGQLAVLDERVLARRKVFELYKNGLSDFECLEWMPEPDGDFSNRWLTAVRLNPEKTRIKPVEMISRLSNFNIEARHLWKPMHLQPLFSEAQYFSHTDTDFCQDLFNSGLCLPSGSSMSNEQTSFVIDKIRYILNN